MRTNLFFIVLCFLTLLGCSEDTIGISGSGTLTGTVVTELDNTPLANVKISTNPASTTIFTDSTGFFSIPSVSMDDYSVQAELGGYVTAFEAVSISDNEISNVVFEMALSTADNIPPQAVELISPEDGMSSLETQVTFQWSSGKNDTDLLNYTLELRNERTDEIIEYSIEEDTTYTVNNLKLGTSYFWQITTTDGLNEPVRSAISQFRTDDVPDNPFLFTRFVDGNSVIYSGDRANGTTDENSLRLTTAETNSFRPKASLEVGKIAFLRTIGGDTHLFTMNMDGSQVEQVTNSIPVNGFRLSEVSFTWAQNGSRLYYPNFDKLYSIDPDGGGSELIYTTNDGSFITEVVTANFDNDLVAIKTNNSDGYDVQIFTVQLSSQDIETEILQSGTGAAGGLDLDANGNKLLFTRDISGSENSQYRRFSSRVFIYDFETENISQINSFVQNGENDLDPKWSPSEGEIVLTRVDNNLNAIPSIYVIDLDDINTNNSDQLLFTNAFQPDWE